MSAAASTPDLTFVTLIHQALRVDGARLAATISALPDGDRGRLVPIREFYDRFREQLLAHHTHEDKLFFPALAARVGADRMHLDELSAQHAQLDPQLEAVAAAFDTLADPTSDFAVARGGLVRALSTMVEHIRAHLDEEEAVALPLFTSEMSVQEYDELEAKARKATPREQSTFMVPWLAEHASPEQRKAWFGSAPPLRLVYLVTRRRYRRVDAALAPAT